MLDVIKQNRLRKQLGVGPYSGAPSVRQKPINGSVFRWGAGPFLVGDTIITDDVQHGNVSPNLLRKAESPRNVDSGKANVIPLKKK